MRVLPAIMIHFWVLQLPPDYPTSCSETAVGGDSTVRGQ
jgi:hypothetical protein